MRWTFSLLSLAAMGRAAAQSSSGSGSSFTIDEPTVEVSCLNTAAAFLWSDANVTMCAEQVGINFTELTEALSDANASSACSNARCYGVYKSVVNLNLQSDCVVGNNILLLGGAIDIMARSAYCVDNSSFDYNYNYSAVSNNSSGSNASSGFSDVISSPAAQSTGDSNKTRIVTIVCITVGVLVAFTIVVVAVAWYKRQSMRELRAAYADPFVVVKPSTGGGGGGFGLAALRREHNDSHNTTDTTSSDEVSLQPLPQSALPNSLWNDEELLARYMRAEDIEDIHIIGNGGHGIVFLVRHRGSRLLASKRLVLEHLTREKTRLFIAEIKLVAKLEHPCIVQFVGAAWTTESDLQALFEYMPNGDLCTYLAKTSQQDERESWDLMKIQIAMDVAEALVYVHSFAPPLVHRDLKSRNVLLGEDMRAKLTDFGVSRYYSRNHTMTTGVGTSRWLAPEVITGGGEYDEKCDIYSLGMVLSELDTHRLPFAGVRMPSGNPMPEMHVVQMVSQGRLQPTFRPTCPESLRDIALRCAAFNPKDRPSAIEVSYVLRTIAKKEFGL